MNEFNVTKYECPICKVPLHSCVGGKLNKTGFSLWCANKECNCQEVIGYGSTEANAFDIIKEKYKFTKGM